MRIGLIGYGYIGRFIVERIQDSGGRFEIAFIHNRSAEALASIDSTLRLDDLGEACACRPDLIVECAHPTITGRFGESFLGCADYMPFSVSALADDALRSRLEASAKRNGTRILIPRGALLGGDELLSRAGRWTRVRITFRKHPENIDLADSGINPAQLDSETVIYDGSVRGIAQRYPRNVNTMVACALASTGLDACEARLVSDPNLNCAVAEVEAWDADGGMVRTEQRQPLVGVSGTGMLSSAWHSILRACGCSGLAIELV